MHNHISLTSVAQTRLSPPSSRHQSLHVSFCTVRINRINKKNHNNQTHEYVVKAASPGVNSEFLESIPDDVCSTKHNHTQYTHD